ncbi:ParB/RepB/Spo0J family partition protein [Desulfothermus naphthae]
MASPKGLGKGLDALFRDKIQINNNSLSDEPNKLRYIYIDDLEPSPFQPRSIFSEEAIEELAQSIKSQGLLQPILVRKKSNEEKYEIIAGERRYLACKRAGVREIPAIVCTLSDEECMVVSLVENLQREDLNVIEEARALDKIRSLLNLTQEELAKRVGKSRSHVANTMRLLQLEEEILQGIFEGKISAGHGRALLGISSKEDRIKVYEYILKKNASVRDVEKIANYWKKNGSLPKYCKLDSPKRTLVKDSILKEITKVINSKLGLKATMRGTLTSGSVTIKYSSKEELISILKHLNIAESVNFEENVSHETIDDNHLNS